MTILAKELAILEITFPSFQITYFQNVILEINKIKSINLKKKSKITLIPDVMEGHWKILSTGVISSDLDLKGSRKQLV